MARIRSIKPSFTLDGDVKRLTDSCALFFVLFWMFCDDEGKYKIDWDQLAAEMGGRWRVDKLKKFVRVLTDSGQTQVSLCSEWLRTTNWSHQKIDRPKQPKVKMEEIQWVTNTDSTMNRDRSSIVRRKDRIGEERIGQDGISLARGAQAPAHAQESPAPEISNLEPDQDTQIIVADSPPLLHVPASGSSRKRASAKSAPITNSTWEAYATAYFNRYGTEPVRNATVNGQLASLVRRLGDKAAPAVAAFYVSHSENFYVRQMHPVGLLLKDAEALHTQWKTGVSPAPYSRAENRSQGNRGALERYVKRLKTTEGDQNGPQD